MAKPNYKQIYAIKASREKKIREVCPGIPDAPGIYIFYRIDEAGIWNRVNKSIFNNKGA